MNKPADRRMPKGPVVHVKFPIVTTYPESKKPRSRLKPRGVWTYPPGAKRTSDNHMIPQPVVVYPPGHKPDNLGGTGPYGVWAYAPGTRPKKEGKFQPKDILVYPKGVTPPNDGAWRPEGYWTYPPENWSPSSNPTDAMLSEPRALLAVEEFEQIEKPRETFIDLSDWKDVKRYKPPPKKRGGWK